MAALTLTSADVREAFARLCGELQRHGFDTSEMILQHVQAPTSYRIHARDKAGVFYAPAYVPNAGFLGTSAVMAFSHLNSLFRGLVWARQIREEKARG